MNEKLGDLNIRKSDYIAVPLAFLNMTQITSYVLTYVVESVETDYIAVPLAFLNMTQITSYVLTYVVESVETRGLSLAKVWATFCNFSKID